MKINKMEEIDLLKIETDAGIFYKDFSDNWYILQKVTDKPLRKNLNAASKKEEDKREEMKKQCSWCRNHRQIDNSWDTSGNENFWYWGCKHNLENDGINRCPKYNID